MKRRAYPARRPILPLKADPFGRYLPWLVAFSVYVAALAVSGLLTIQSVTAQWATSARTAITVQVPGAIMAGSERDARLTAIVEELRTTPGVATVALIPEQTVRDTLSAWLESAAYSNWLPLPRLIDVQTREDANVDVAALRVKLQSLEPGVRVDDHAQWLASLLGVTDTLQVLAVILVATIILVTAGAVVVVTLSGLGVHHDTIDILHLIGARDSAVAGHFANRTGRRSLMGAAAGSLLAAASLVALNRAGADASDALLVDASFGAVQWAAVAALPPAVALLSMLTAWLTVMRFLASRY